MSPVNVSDVTNSTYLVSAAVKEKRCERFWSDELSPASMLDMTVIFGRARKVVLRGVSLL